MAWTQTAGPTFSETTGSAPTVAADGFNVIGLVSLYIVVSADSTRTLSGAGTLQCYLYDAIGGAPARWIRYPAADLSVTSSAVRDMAFPPVMLRAPRGRMAWVPSGVTVSAGAVTVNVHGYDPARAANAGY